MGNSIWVLLLIQVVLIGLNAVFACAELAVLSVNETKLTKMAEQGNKRAKRLERLTGQPEKFLATIQVAITLSGFLGSAFAAENFSDSLVNWLIGLGIKVPYATLDAIAVVLITLILSYFTLVFGELVPKRLAMKKSEQIALGISGLVSGISVLFRPIVWLLSVSTNAVLRMCGIDPNEQEEQVSEEEIRMMVDAGSETGAIDDEEKEFIQNIFEFDDLMAGEITTRRTEVDALFMEDDMDEWERIIHESRHTRYPVCEESADHVIGILNAKDYFRLKNKSRENVMAEAVRAPYFVPKTIKADVLFRNMRKDRVSLAVVLDEYGGMIGIVTLNDLLEELVGDLNVDVTEEEQGPSIEKTGENIWEVYENIALSELEENVPVDFDDEEYDTLTGVVFDALGYIPQDGEQDIDVQVEQMHVHISRIEGHQIVRAAISVEASEKEE